MKVSHRIDGHASGAPGVAGQSPRLLDQVATSTQNQALAALLFLYREVLGVELPWMRNIRRAKRPERLPVVLTRDEVRALLGELSGVRWLMAGLLYGSGLRLLECLRLRVQDVDFARREILVRHGKGGKDRRTMQPAGLEALLRAQCVDGTAKNSKCTYEGDDSVLAAMPDV